MSRENQKWTDFLYNVRKHYLLKERITEWYNRAKEATDPFNKFIYQWIAFDAFATNYTEEVWSKEIKAVLKEDSYLKKHYYDMLEKNYFLEKIEQLQNECSVWDAREKYAEDPNYSESIDDINNFDQVINVLYKIRNNLFHGGKSPKKARNIKLVIIGYEILSEFLSPLFKNANIF